ncbi:hypothetical protein [Neobacillus terrae]|uniref:hypothetical protein n=1 Tax=Neobacillus terrae TaxID=3034837 RepID=UPI00140C634E|nr:hypothetical protein [Neobacillus terrae]NHM32912.1 hypothetical protein [Neobacillus terrae]
MGLLLGIFIGLVSGAILGAAISLPVGSALGIFIDRSYSGWALEIEIVLVLLSAFIIFKFFNIHLRKNKKAI